MDVRLSDIGTFLCLSEIPGVSESPAALIRRVSSFGWNQVVLKAARVAAVIANAPSGALAEDVVQLTKVPLERHWASPIRDQRVVAEYVRSRPGPIAHEAVLYFVTALALLYGADDGPMPDDEAFAYLLLSANDHCMDWRTKDGERDLTRREQLVAVAGRAGLHNDRQDGVNKFVRGCLFMRDPPPRTPEWTDLAAWNSFQEAALGSTLNEYLETLAGPLVIMSRLWGDLRDTAHPYPVIEPSRWLQRFPASKTFVDELSVTREAARSALKSQVRTDGLPVGPTLFHRRPFIRLADDMLVAVSPWVVREVLNNGLWARHLAAAKQAFGDDAGAKKWSGAFGDMFEAWCRRVGTWAAATPGFRATPLDAPANLGDLVFMRGKDVALFEVKSRLVREDVLRGGQSTRRALEYFEEFFFAARTGAHRGGVIRQVDAGIRELRRGAFEPLVPRYARVMPCVVTFDDIGGDNPAMYRWLKARCREEGLLQGGRVRGVTLMDADLFELLLGVAPPRGRISTPRAKTKPPGDEARLAVLLKHLAATGAPVRVPEVTRQFESIFGRIRALLLHPEAGGSTGA
ncbi:MAG: hypothetical protein AMXMBFR56_55510 [Polyangiaceae bacterium]